MIRILGYLKEFKSLLNSQASERARSKNWHSVENPASLLSIPQHLFILLSVARSLWWNVAITSSFIIDVFSIQDSIQTHLCVLAPNSISQERSLIDLA